MLAKQGQLESSQGVGGWMLFEVAQDFGMGEFPLLGGSFVRSFWFVDFLLIAIERPIRAYEVVADVVNSWDKDRTVNIIIAKKTELAYLLRPSVSSFSALHRFMVLTEQWCCFYRQSLIPHRGLQDLWNGRVREANGINVGWSCASTVFG